MTQTHSRLRQEAEIAFANAQSQFLARERAVEELDTIVQGRVEKTLRLKKARLTKEPEDRSRVTAALLSNYSPGPDVRANDTSNGLQI